MSLLVRSSKFFVAALATSLLLASSVFAAEIEQARLDAIAADIQARVDANRLSGAIVMVAKDGEVQMHQAFGYKTVDDKVPMSTDSIFRIFSMTKPITGTALMILHDEGKFQLSDPVEKYIPEFANLQVFTELNADGSMASEPANHKMTIRELVSHTGGLLYTPPLSNGPVAAAYSKAGILGRDTTLAEQIPQLGDIPLGYQPGSQWVYSISVDVQGYLVEVLSGQKFDTFLQERIFGPLGMVDTSFYVAEEKASRLAGRYVPGADGNLRRTDDGSFLKKPAFFSGGGGLTSTSSDYMKFAQMHLNGGILNGERILSEEAVNLMHTNQLPDNLKGIANVYPGNVFGVDFAIVDNSEVFNGAPKGTYWWWGIAGSWFWIDPVNNIVMVGMIQNDDLGYSFQTHGAMRSLMYK